MESKARQWVVSLARYPEPDMSDAGSEVLEKAEALLNLWRRYMPEHEADGSSDFEDFFEQAARLDAAVSSFGESNCWLFTNEGSARNLVSGEERSKEILLAEGAGDYGILHRFTHYDTAWQRSNDVIDGYIRSATFQRLANRALAVCGFAPDDSNGLDLRDALVAFSAAGHHRALIKVARAKHGFFWVEVPEKLTREAADSLMWEAMDMAPLNYEGRSESFLLQERISMEYEYRFFVVNDQVVTGAGCIEEFTPLNSHSQFDDRVRRVRLYEPTEVETRPDVLERYLPFAREAAGAIAAEGALHSYSLDVATGSDGEPLIIELNGLPNSGLYASDPRYITQVLASA